MNDCLVTRFKGTVDTDLLKFGEIVWDVPAIGDRELLLVTTVYSKFSLSWDEGVEVKRYNGTSVQSPIENELGGETFKVKAPNGGTIRLRGKYNMVYKTNASCFVWPMRGVKSLEDIKFWFKCSSLLINNFGVQTAASHFDLKGNIASVIDPNYPFKEITIDYTSIEGNLTSIAQCGSFLQEIRAVDTLIEGNFENLGECTGLTYISLVKLTRPSSITGTIEGFVQRQREAGRTSGSISYLHLFGNAVTFDGDVVSPSNPVTDFAWTANTITLGGKTINA